MYSSDWTSRQSHWGKPSNHKFSEIYKASPDTNFYQTKDMYTNIKHFFLKLAPSVCAPVKKAHTTRTRWYQRPLHWFIEARFKKEHAQLFNKYINKYTQQCIHQNLYHFILKTTTDHWFSVYTNTCIKPNMVVLGPYQPVLIQRNLETGCKSHIVTSSFFVGACGNIPFYPKIWVYYCEHILDKNYSQVCVQQLLEVCWQRCILWSRVNSN